LSEDITRGDVIGALDSFADSAPGYMSQATAMHEQGFMTESSYEEIMAYIAGLQEATLSAVGDLRQYGSDGITTSYADLTKAGLTNLLEQYYEVVQNRIEEIMRLYEADGITEQSAQELIAIAQAEAEMLGEVVGILKQQ
jgi:hypothetical protein